MVRVGSAIGARQRQRHLVQAERIVHLKEDDESWQWPASSARQGQRHLAHKLWLGFQLDVAHFFLKHMQTPQNIKD